MSVADIYNSDVLTAESDWSVERVTSLLLDENVSSIVIVDPTLRPLGIVTETPLLMATVDPRLKTDPVSLHMHRKFISVALDEPLEQVVEKFLLYRVRLFPVVQESKLLGIVTRRDVVRALHGTRIAG